MSSPSHMHGWCQLDHLEAQVTQNMVTQVCSLGPFHHCLETCVLKMRHAYALGIKCNIFLKILHGSRWSLQFRAMILYSFLEEQQAMPSVWIPMLSSNGNGLQTIWSVQLTGVMSTRLRTVNFSTLLSMVVPSYTLSFYILHCLLTSLHLVRFLSHSSLSLSLHHSVPSLHWISTHIELYYTSDIFFIPTSSSFLDLLFLYYFMFWL